MLTTFHHSRRVTRALILVAGILLPSGGRSVQAETISGVSVTVSGASSSTYAGEGYVVGPSNGQGSYSPYTLASLNGGNAFLINSGSDRITITTAQPIYSISFDFEIFPDGTTPNGNQSSTSNSNWPDFTFAANGNDVFTVLGIMPGSTPPTEPAGITALGLDNGSTFSHSPNSGSNTELAPQLLASSGVWSFPNGVTTLEFIDWPATIGITNLQFNPSLPTAVPEPATLFVFGGSFVGLVALRRLRKKSPI